MQQPQQMPCQGSSCQPQPQLQMPCQGASCGGQQMMQPQPMPLMGQFMPALIGQQQNCPPSCSQMCSPPCPTQCCGSGGSGGMMQQGQPQMFGQPRMG